MGKADFLDFVEVEVGKEGFKVGDGFEMAGGIGEIEGDAAMAGTFGDADGSGSEGFKGFESGQDEGRVSVDAGIGVEFDQVGFEEDVSALDVEFVGDQDVANNGEEVGGVGGGAADGDEFGWSGWGGWGT